MVEADEIGGGAAGVDEVGQAAAGAVGGIVVGAKRAGLVIHSGQGLVIVAAQRRCLVVTVVGIGPGVARQGDTVKEVVLGCPSAVIFVVISQRNSAASKEVILQVEIHRMRAADIPLSDVEVDPLAAIVGESKVNGLR